MNAPRLNRKLVLETPVKIADGAGGYVEDWQPLGTLWAQVSARTGRETAQSGAPVSAMSYRIVVRGAPFGAPDRPKPEQRFREGERLFVIQAVAEEDADGRFITCFATEEIAV
ncbi:phage head closure protein [Roseobacter sp. YSTF-M11]|uniref:Phage head closure protein n=1 Tax=Roseobacter insulae TaxID=2859783 RepID=A0A9X1FWW1_9RHOB|nr:phage head closure protein [Roseobacter insulae]MBW4708535.1 phage head closure protein [Roseobacter insulae]